MSESTEKRTVLRGGVCFGLLGVLQFSGTLPATRLAVAGFEPQFVAFGRIVLAAVLAGLLLFWRGERRPAPHEWKRLAIVAAGVVVGFPLLSAWAMVSLPASHGALVLALLPLATAGMAALRAGERPSPRFWLAALAGSLLVAVFALHRGAGEFLSFAWADLALLGAVIAAALGYAEGGVLARTLGGWQVICWSLLVALPLALPLALLSYPWQAPPGALSPWLGLLYVALFSQLIGFFAWYRGLRDGGIARIGQLLLLQPFLTMVISALLLGERVAWSAYLFAVLVVLCVALGRGAAVATPSPKPPAS